MKTILFLFLIIPSFSFGAHSTVLVVGDSWAQFMCWQQSFDSVFASRHVDASTICNGTTEFGVRSNNWPTRSAHSQTLADLKSFPSIKIVYLSLGGNDFLKGWKKSMPNEDLLFRKIASDTLFIVNEILKVRPDVKVLVSGYDYGNFKEYSKILKAYTKLYQDMGSPATGEVHRAILRFSNVMSELADQNHVFYIHHFGLGHYYYGNSHYKLKAGQTLPPSVISTLANSKAYGGNPDFEVSLNSLMEIWPLHDAYHPNANEFKNIADHSYMNVIRYIMN